MDEIEKLENEIDPDAVPNAELPASTWYAPGCMALGLTAAISFVFPSASYMLLALCAVLWGFLYCLRTVEMSDWRKDLRRTQAALDRSIEKKMEKDAKKAAKAGVGKKRRAMISGSASSDGMGQF